MLYTRIGSFCSKISGLTDIAAFQQLFLFSENTPLGDTEICARITENNTAVIRNHRLDLFILLVSAAYIGFHRFLRPGQNVLPMATRTYNTPKKVLATYTGWRILHPSEES